MKHTFTGSKAKLRRSEKLLAELEQASADYFANHAPKTVAIISTEPGKPPISFTTTIEGIPDSISTIVGDILHNLRAALDMAACDLVQGAGKSTNHVYFPFCDKPEELDKTIKRKNFHRAGPDAVALVKSFKPYRGGNVALRAIHDLDVRDKHQSLIPSVMSFMSPTFRLWDDDGILNPMIIGDVNTGSEFRFVFPPGTELMGKEYIPTLHKLVELTEGIVEAFIALANR